MLTKLNETKNNFLIGLRSKEDENIGCNHFLKIIHFGRYCHAIGVTLNWIITEYLVYFVIQELI